MRYERSSHEMRVTASAYLVSYDEANPWMITLEQGGISRQLSLAAGVHTPAGWDAVGEPHLERVEEGEKECVLRFACSSRAWQRMEIVVRLREDDLDFQVVVEGEGTVDSISLLEGAVEDKMPDPRSTMTRLNRKPRPLRAYSAPSPSAHSTIFCPQPTSYHRPIRPYYEEAIVTAACTFGPQEYNTYFSPGIFCFVLGDEGEKNFLSAGICAPAGENHYHTFRYSGGEGFGFSLDYDGMLTVSGIFTSPRLRIGFSDDRYHALEDCIAFLRAHGMAPRGPQSIPEWWRKPIFCGWGQQTHWARAAENREALPFDAGPIDTFAGGMATQAAYEEMVKIMEEADLPYGTLIIDMGWSTSNALPAPDPKKWPDLRAFIDAQHARGKKVLLWLCCWTTDGIPPEFLMDHDAGLRDVPDPTNPAFIEELTRRITALISPEGFDADGFKLDFTGDIPRGKGYRPHRQAWGVELLRVYLEAIHSAVKAAKPNAMLETHCATPYFADLTDVLRLNDMFFETLDVNPLMAFRSDMARIACPEWPIDCDNDPFIDRDSWMGYMRFQPQIGVPSLYSLTNMSMSGEPMQPGDLQEIAGIWREYLNTL